MKRWGMVSSAALVIAANAFVLAGIALDRAGGVFQRVELTQRELPVAWTGEDSGIAVRLETWGMQGQMRPTINVDKLTELGFDCSMPAGAPSARTHYRRQLPRRALVALEYGRSPQPNTPPFAIVDVGTSFSALTAKYPDQGRYLIVPALIRVGLDYYPGSRAPIVVGWPQPLVYLIHVPQPYARTLRELRGKNSYHLTLCYGKRLEPWVCGCRP